MPLEQIKTQVLLLHSEQSTLDTLSAGFDDRYTVHVATSGTEALNTLGETPIHVIVSAQNLPGMSGVEALREAKKRSPETIGILLAGPNDKGLEALVGDKEVFQIVRGGINGDDLGRLIDNATQQMRLMALAESANDTRAVPEDTGEHIIMETAENGSMIVSDGTGTLPALDPKKVSAAVTAGAQTVDVLVLSKDEEFLATIRESTRGLHNVHAATTLAAAEETIAKEGVGVVVVDAGMVGSNVEKLTVHLRRSKPRLVSIVAGRRDDGEMLMDLINRGKVYRFLLKPVSPGRARLAIEASVKHHVEAPDSAFKMAGAGKPAAKAAEPTKPASKPKAKATKEAAPAPAPEPAEDRKDPVILPDIDVDLPDGAMDDAFGEKDTSFTQTMTGIVASVSESIGSKSKDDDNFSAIGDAAAAEMGDSGGGSLFANPMILGAGAVALVAVAGLGFWLFSGSSDDAPAAVDPAPVADVLPAPAEEASAARPEPVAQPAAEDLVARARELRDAGRIYAPAGNNAIEAYAAALASTPGDRDVQEEFADVIDQAISLGEVAMLEGRIDDAAAAIGLVAATDPGHPRLPFLTAQLEQMQLRSYLDTARAAILDSRYQDAANAIAAARALDPADTSGIDAVAAELSGARSAERVEDTLATAAARLDAGQLLEPANDNARYYYELALSNDPGNATALAGLKMITGTLVLEARAAIDAGRFGTAESLLGDARAIDSESSEVAAADSALADARQRVADDQRRQEEAQAAQERQAEAERVAAEERARAEQATAALAAQEAASSSDSADAGGSLDAGSAPTAAASPEASEPPPAAPVPVQDQAPIAISNLTRTKYVAPKYPRTAERRSLSGWVDVVFTVGIDGTVSDIDVRASEPGDVFVNSAIKAVEKWEFEPIIENDRYVEKRAGVRMMFAIE